MHFADSIVIFLLALILFGPKKLPEIARQIGKLMVELRRASNEFKSQIDDELRNMELEQRRRKLEAESAQLSPASATLENGTLTTPNALPLETEPMILPPSVGEIVSASHPYAPDTSGEMLDMPVASQELLEAASSEPHPVYAEALAAEQNHNSHSTGLDPENTQAVVNHG